MSGININSPTAFSYMLSTSISNKHMTSIFWKCWMFTYKSKIFWLSWMEATKGNVFQAVKVIVTRSCGHLQAKRKSYMKIFTPY